MFRRQCSSKIANCESYRPRLSIANDHSIDAENVWVWKTQGSEFYFDAGENVRARVETERWNGANETPATAENESADTKARAAVAYSIEVSMNEPGLGGSNWW